jgi:hypothetical protein
MIVLKSELQRFRNLLRFAPDTALPGSPEYPPHCAVVSLLAKLYFNAYMVSSVVTTREGEETSHWYNCLVWHGRIFDFDLTGDQFGFDSIQVARELYENRRPRIVEEINEETLNRAKLLAERSDLGYLFDEGLRT